MKKHLPVIFLIMATITAPAQDTRSLINNLRTELKDNLTKNLLAYWSSKAPDYVHGGFYGRINSDDIPVPGEDKGGILNARILWTYSSAFRMLKDTSYLRLASRAEKYILLHFIDKQYGGAFQSLRPGGEPSDTRKQTYTQSFFIYGLSEYYRATGNKEALQAAKDIFSCLEKYVYDVENNGYFEVFTRDWQRSHDLLIGEKSINDEKTMNTSLHLMEAYTNLYRVWPDRQVKDRLRTMVDLFLDRIIDNKRFHLINFMTRDWKSNSTTDSYGHDIESSWLICEAAGLLNDPALLQRVRKVAVKIADAASEGLLPDGSLADEKDYTTGEMKKSRSWWAQAEAVVGFYNAWQLTGDQKYLKKSADSWKYINGHFTDHKNGGWYPAVNESGETVKGDKAGFWICPYHNSRMSLEIIERSSGDNL